MDTPPSSSDSSCSAKPQTRTGGDVTERYSVWGLEMTAYPIHGCMALGRIRLNQKDQKDTFALRYA